MNGTLHILLPIYEFVTKGHFLKTKCDTAEGCLNVNCCTDFVYSLCCFWLPFMGNSDWLFFFFQARQENLMRRKSSSSSVRDPAPRVSDPDPLKTSSHCDHVHSPSQVKPTWKLHSGISTCIITCYFLSPLQTNKNIQNSLCKS